MARRPTGSEKKSCLKACFIWVNLCIKRYKSDAAVERNVSFSHFGPQPIVSHTSLASTVKKKTSLKKSLEIPNDAIDAVEILVSGFLVSVDNCNVLIGGTGIISRRGSLTRHRGLWDLLGWEGERECTGSGHETGLCGRCQGATCLQIEMIH